MANICREVKLLHQLICTRVEAVAAEAERMDLRQSSDLFLIRLQPSCKLVYDGLSTQFLKLTMQAF